MLLWSYEQDRGLNFMSDKRRAKRIKEEAKVTIILVSKDSLSPGRKIIYHLTKDISAAGIKIQTNTFLPINSMIKIELSLKEPPRVVSAIGMVRRVKTLYADELFEVGIEFVDTSQEIISIIKEHIERQSKFPVT
jgi:hypothetical protein